MPAACSRLTPSPHARRRGPDLGYGRPEDPAGRRTAARCRSRCMPDAARSSRNTSILLSSHVRLGTWQVFHPPATEPGYSERPVAVTQWSSARHRHWPFCCCSSPAPPGPSHHGQRARNTRPADPDRRHPADYRPRQARLAPPRRAHRAPPRTILLRLCPPARPPRAHADPAAALPGISRPLGHWDLPGQQRPVHRVRAARLLRAQDRHPRRRSRWHLHPLRGPCWLIRRHAAALPEQRRACSS